MKREYDQSVFTCRQRKNVEISSVFTKVQCFFVNEVIQSRGACNSVTFMKMICLYHKSLEENFSCFVERRILLSGLVAQPCNFVLSNTKLFLVLVY